MQSKYMHRRQKLSAAITAALLTMGGTAAVAQEQAGESAEDTQMEEITVTATRRETSLVDVPYNISAVSGDFIDRGKILSSGELLRGVPGAQVVDYGARNAGSVNTIKIRGLALDSAIQQDYSLSTASTVSTYVNETPVFANLVLKDIDRVEVLRGPQGTLYGSGSLGGTVRYITRRPELGEFSGRVEGSLSTTDGSSGTNWDADVMLNLPLGETFAARILAGRIDYAGIFDLPNAYVLDGNGFPVAPDGILADTAEYERIKDVDTVEITYARASLLWQPNDRFDALFTYNHQEDDVGGRMMPTQGVDGWGDEYGRYETGSVQREPSDREIDIASLEMNLDLGFATLTSSTSTYDHNGDSISENTGFSAQAGWLADYYGNAPRPMHSAVRDWSDEAFVQELRLVSNTDGRFDWIVGGFYRDQDKTSNQVNYLRNFMNWAQAAWGCCAIRDDDFRYMRDENFKDTALFGELTWNITDTLRLTGGVRWFEVDYVNETNLGVGLYDTFAFDDVTRIDESDSDTIFKLNASWDLSEQVMMYGTISEGYRRGGTNAIPLSGIFAENPEWQRYGPDFTTNYEIGFKGGSAGTFFSAALFYVDWKDIQLETATTYWGFYAAQNGPKAHTQGLEVEYNKRWENGWSINAGYAFTEGKLDADFPSADGLYLVAPKGRRLPGLAQHTLNLMVQNEWDFSNGWTWVNRVSGYYQSETENAILTSPRFSLEHDGFQLWDLNSNVVMGNFTVGLFVKNLFNERGVVGVFKEEYMGTSPEQNYYGNGSKSVVARPRTIGITGSWSF